MGDRLGTPRVVDTFLFFLVLLFDCVVRFICSNYRSPRDLCFDDTTVRKTVALKYITNNVNFSATFFFFFG